MAAAPVVAYVGLGANLGDTRGTLSAAAQAIGALPDTRLRRMSSWYRSAPVEATGPDFLNAVAAIDTTLPAEALLAQLRDIEARWGRERPYRNAPRTLDLDLLLYGDQVIGTPELVVPHPRMHQRAFVLVPLAEVAPAGLCIRGHGPVQDLLAFVADQAIHKLDDDPQETSR